MEALSYDHKPGNYAERQRITAAGGWVEYNRVNGNLALSRALGDFIFKKNQKMRPESQIVTGKEDKQVRLGRRISHSFRISPLNAEFLIFFESCR